MASPVFIASNEHGHTRLGIITHHHHRLLQRELEIMGYTHYWRREKEIPIQTMQAIVTDFKKVLPDILDAGVTLADGHGKNEAVITNNDVWFNGRHDCGHPKDSGIVIPWPTDDAGGVANPFKHNAESGHWFAGTKINTRVCDGHCDYETVHFPRIIEPSDWQKPDEGLYFEFCKTAFRPYDLATIVFLIIAKHHLQDRIKVSSDGATQHWLDGFYLCQKNLGYGIDGALGHDGDLYFSEATHENKTQAKT